MRHHLDSKSCWWQVEKFTINIFLTSLFSWKCSHKENTHGGTGPTSTPSFHPTLGSALPLPQSCPALDFQALCKMLFLCNNNSLINFNLTHTTLRNSVVTAQFKLASDPAFQLQKRKQLGVPHSSFKNHTKIIQKYELMLFCLSIPSVVVQSSWLGQFHIHLKYQSNLPKELLIYQLHLSVTIECLQKSAKYVYPFPCFHQSSSLNVSSSIDPKAVLLFQSAALPPLLIL